MFLFLSRVKSLGNFLLFGRESEECLDFALFGGIFWQILELYVTFFGIFGTVWVFWADLLPIRFVVINALFRVYYFWRKPCLCKKKLSFCMSVLIMLLLLSLVSLLRVPCWHVNPTVRLDDFQSERHSRFQQLALYGSLSLTLPT